jgi:hypothetical protein
MGSDRKRQISQTRGNAPRIFVHQAKRTNPHTFATQKKKSGQYAATQPNQSKNSNNNDNNQPQ